MDWLHNPIADMRGPQFLLLYACVIGVTLLSCLILLHGRDQSRSLPKLPIPPDLDPFEVAFLRGGHNEVLRLTLINLIQRGYLKVSANHEQILRPPTPPSADHLTHLESRVYDFFLEPKKPSELFDLSAASDLRVVCDPLEKKLLNEKLLVSGSHRGQGRGAVILGGLLILGLGAYKLAAAVAKGRHNVWFLILMALAALVVLVVMNALANGRLTARGRTYVRQLELAFRRLRSNLGSHAKIQDDLLLLAVSIFGVGVLEATAFDHYPKMFQRAAAGSACGAACGSSCGGGNGCGGGGCGGGGCGGCGGS